jgi:hypothetical protein
VFSGDSEKVADFVKGLVGDGRRAAGLLGVSVPAEATVGVGEAFMVVLAELVDRRSIHRSRKRWLGGRQTQGVHGGRVVPMHNIERSVATCSHGLCEQRYYMHGHRL